MDYKKKYLKYKKKYMELKLQMGGIHMGPKDEFFLNLIGPMYVFQTNIDEREILFLGDQHTSLDYKKNGVKYSSTKQLNDKKEIYLSRQNITMMTNAKYNRLHSLDKKNENFKKIKIEHFNEFVKLKKEEFKKIIEAYNKNKININKDNFIDNYIYHLANNNETCIDLFLEEHLNKQSHFIDNQVSLRPSYLGLVNNLYGLCGKDKKSIMDYDKQLYDAAFCKNTFKSLRYHQTDVRKIWTHLIPTYYVHKKNTSYSSDYLTSPCIDYLKEYIKKLDTIILKPWFGYGDIDSDKKELEKLALKFNNLFKYSTTKAAQSFKRSNGSVKKNFKEEFQLIQKQYKKSIFANNFEKFESTFNDVMETDASMNWQCNFPGGYNLIGIIMMNLYNIFRMFVRKDIWDSNKRSKFGRLTENCKKSPYPKIIISYQGAAHSKFYAEFIKKYFNLNSEQYYELKYQGDTDENFRYLRIKCDIKNDVILPKF